MENLLFSINAVFPVFLIVALGYFLRRKQVINDNFVDISTKIGFQFALPCLLFRQIYQIDLKKSFQPKLIGYAVAGTLIIVLLCAMIVPHFTKDRKQQGAFIHCVYRSNYAIIGLPLAINILGEEGATPAALLLPFVVPLYNILAVVIFTLYSPEQHKQKIDFKKLLLDILKNPLIIGCMLGLITAGFHIPLPTMVTKSVGYLADLATPIAMLALGGQFDFEKAWGNIKISGTATFFKLIVSPLIFVPLAVLLGFRGPQLGAVFVLFCASTAVSSYVMAKNMHSDEELCGQIVLLTTFFSPFAIFLGTFLLKTFSLI